jgi:hypothetical protein
MKPSMEDYSCNGEWRLESTVIVEASHQEWCKFYSAIRIATAEGRGAVLACSFPERWHGELLRISYAEDDRELSVTHFASQSVCTQVLSSSGMSKNIKTEINLHRFQLLIRNEISDNRNNELEVKMKYFRSDLDYWNHSFEYIERVRFIACVFYR